jgi:hypothetical protein
MDGRRVGAKSTRSERACPLIGYLVFGHGRRQARLGRGARRDAVTFRLPIRCLVWLLHGMRARRVPCEEWLKRGLRGSK